MNARRHYGGARTWLLAATLIPLGASGAFAQNAPGNLPWGAPPSTSSPSSSQSGDQGGSHLLPTFAAELFRHAYGNAYFGFDTVGSDQSRLNTNDYGLSLSSSGYFLDPRLWSQIMTVDVDRFGGGSGGASRGLGFRLNGTLLRSRSFPLRIVVVRRAANANSLGLDNHTSYRNLILDWTLRQPKLANIGISASWGGSDQDTSLFAPSPFRRLREKDQSISGQITRVIKGWSLAGTAYRTRVRTTTSTFDLGELITGRSFEVERRLRLGRHGQFQTSFRHNQRSDSRRASSANFGPPSTSYSLNRGQALLDYQHTKKLRGSYDVAYTSNLTEAAIAAAFLPGGAGTSPPVQPNPGLLQALASHNRSSAVAMGAGWRYNRTRRLFFGVRIGQTFLNTPELLTTNPITNTPFGLVRSFTSLGGDAGYSRSFGKWEMNWRGGLTHHWDQRRQGAGFTEDSLSLGMGVSRRLRRWLWTSDFSYTDFYSGQLGTRLYSEERWVNTFKTRLNPRIALDVEAEVLHLDTDLTSLFLRNKSKDTALLLHGTLSSRRWNVAGGTGLRNANSMFFPLDLSNPLSTIVLGQFTPLASTLDTADHYAQVFGSFSARRNLSFTGAYRRDNFQILDGSRTLYTGAEFGLEYHLRKLTVEVGYQLQDQLTGMVKFHRDRVYVRLRRPFRLY